MSGAKGARMEREIANVFQELDCVVVRTAASGGSSDRPLPDLHVGHGGHSIAVELKSGQRPENLTMDEARRLHEFAIEMGSKPVVGVRYDGDRSLYLANLADAPRTDGDNVSISTVSERFEAHCFATVGYSKGRGGVVVERGREEFHRGVMG